MTVRRLCPVCGAGPDEAEPFIADTIDEVRLNASSFASRKVPEYMSHAMVRCRTCETVYVAAPPSQSDLGESYHQADYDSAEEAEHAANSYERTIRPVLERLHGRRGAALEIGTGTGAFLERLAAHGFASTVGIEPSVAAIDAAPAHRRAWIREGIFEKGTYPSDSFDLVTCFMTLEHVRDPGDVADEVLRILKPGGAFVSVTHDYRALVNRMMGTKSPIIDLEHMQIFSKESVQQLLLRRQFVDVEAHSFRNAYRPSYWLRLAPVPAAMKTWLLRHLRGSILDRRRLAVNVGNVMSWGYKPG